MPPDLGRLLRPRSIAVLGGSWARSVVQQCLQMNFTGEIWPVHPQHREVHGLACYSSLEQLPGVPDATFIGVNRHLSIGCVATLSSMGAGGAVCFASGFSEARAEDEQGTELQLRLLEASAGMPLIGPNCYGLINYLDGALLWPDQHGGERVDRGVAMITQSSNIAINLTMQQRGLPIAYLLTAGNQAQLSIGQLGCALLDDERVTALALHIEGFGNIVDFEQLAARAKSLGKPIVAIKVGRSANAQQAMVSHTNSLSGSDAAAEAFLARLGISRLYSLSALIETLKLLHVVGPLEGSRIHSMSCSGGEASLMADAAMQHAVTYPSLNENQQSQLRSALGPLVALNNPLDYHTYIWNDAEAMTAAYSAMMSGSADLTLLVNDFPRDDRCDYPSWLKAIDALIAARDKTGGAAAMLATLPENMPEEIARQLMADGVVPLCGIEDAMVAIEAAAQVGISLQQPIPQPILQLSERLLENEIEILTEATAKRELEAAGLIVPRSVEVGVEIHALSVAASTLTFPVVLKGLGVAHKTEAGVIKLGLTSVEDVLSAAEEMANRVEGFLLEEYIDDTVAELLVSIVRDSTHGLLLTIASGGILAELLSDSIHLLLPFDADSVRREFAHLKASQLLAGYRGAPPAKIDAIVSSVMQLQTYAIRHAEQIREIEINPLLCGPGQAVVADALVCVFTEKK